MRQFDSIYLEIIQNAKETIYLETEPLVKLLSRLQVLDYQNINKDVLRIKGVYFWFKKNDLQYIGIAGNRNGLYGRVVLQHLNEKYLEFRDKKQSSKDFYQLENSINRKRKGGVEVRKGIDKSTFRKKIGRKYNLKPGVETVNYIKEKGTFKLLTLEKINAYDLNMIETILIAFFKPVFNDSKKNVVAKGVDVIPQDKVGTLFKLSE